MAGKSRSSFSNDSWKPTAYRRDEPAFSAALLERLGAGAAGYAHLPSTGHTKAQRIKELSIILGWLGEPLQEDPEGTLRAVAETGYGYLEFGDAGSQPWRFSGEQLPGVVQEHKHFVESIRAGEPLNEGRRKAESNLTVIMGREAAYTDKGVHG